MNVNGLKAFWHWEVAADGLIEYACDVVCSFLEDICDYEQENHVSAVYTNNIRLWSGINQKEGYLCYE